MAPKSTKSGCKVDTYFEGIITDGMVGAVPFFILALKWCFSQYARGRVSTGPGRVLNWWLGRFSERRGRLVFSFDLLKQVAAQGLLHFFNIIFVESKWLRQASHCEVYWFSLVVDTTFGTILMALLLKAVVRPPWFKHNFESDFGNYRGEGHRMSYRIYLKQLAVWLGLVFIMRFIMFILTIIAWGFGIMHLSYHIFVELTTHSFIFNGSPHAEMFIVKTVTPLIFNTFQIIWFDEFIKAPEHLQGTRSSFALTTEPESEKQIFRTKAQIKNLSNSLTLSLRENWTPFGFWRKTCWVRGRKTQAKN